MRRFLFALLAFSPLLLILAFLYFSYSYSANFVNLPQHLLVIGIGLVVLVPIAIVSFLLHALVSVRLTRNERLLWVLLLFFVPFAGLPLYYFLVIQRQG